ncbi:F-box/WD repeat-containing protein 7 [Escovopsis weberi]|uniref:F-box/WD repeat-containing protein 7 n=1 Tax=Escovopsis weberi TaxID=150374 RepID=A0A0M8MYW4_ESCWE|nr:F-box/WD repeat-containing protein 7 [Escovopsis weberi]
MPVAKRKLSRDGAAAHEILDPHDTIERRAQRRRLHEPLSPPSLPPSRDIISALSDELVLRIFSFLDIKGLVDISPVSRRFCALAADSQLWRKDSDKEAVDWKRLYKLRHNWARGQCAVQEVQVSDHGGPQHPDGQTLLRVADGFAVTADLRYGVRAWDLRTGTMLARAGIDKTDDDGVGVGVGVSRPTAIALDVQGLAARRRMDVALGFEDGTFGLWRVDVARGTIEPAYRQGKGSHAAGPLVSVAYSHPYVMTGSGPGFISIFTFAGTGDSKAAAAAAAAEGAARQPQDREKALLPEPQLLRQLKSYYSRMPLALSITRAARCVTASAAYTFSAVGGWAIGVQDFCIRPARDRGRGGDNATNIINDNGNGNGNADDHDDDDDNDVVITSRVAYTSPMEAPRARRPAPECGRGCVCVCGYEGGGEGESESEKEGPTRLAYSHPYLLATMPDNTLVMHLVTGSADGGGGVSISRGMRLWGHTSAIADADVTPRGKAVSISLKGGELRVWELGGHAGRPRPSVEVRPRRGGPEDEGPGSGAGLGLGLGLGLGFWERSASSTPMPVDLADRTSWVGFDREMIVVLRVGLSGRENMVVYDFS